MFTAPIVMLDFETTGLSPAYGDRITEVAALRIVGDRIVERYVSLINCHVRIPSFISELTGITQAMVNRAPAASVVVPELLDFIGQDVLAAHNASFDVKFLSAESTRLGLTPSHANLVCSLKLARRVFPGLPSYKLTNLANVLGIKFNSQAHRAEADAEVAAELLIHIGKHLRKNYQLSALDPQIFSQINKLSAAKVANYLQHKLVSKVA